MPSPPAAYTPLPPSFYASNEVDRNIYKHDTLDCNWPAKGGYMRSVSTPATSVYAYAVAFGWIAGYLVLNVVYRVIPCHGYSQRGSDFIRRLGKVLNGVVLAILFILYGVCIVTWSFSYVQRCSITHK